MFRQHPSFVLAYVIPFAAAGVMWIVYNVRARAFKKTAAGSGIDASLLADLGIFHTLAHCTICKQLDVINSIAAETKNEAQLAQLRSLKNLYSWSIYTLVGGIAIVYLVGLAQQL